MSPSHENAETTAADAGHGPAHGPDTVGGARAGRGEHDHGGHSHGVSANADRRYLLLIALLLLVAFMVTEVVVALTSGSLALLSDAGHMLSDVGAIGGSLWAIRLAARPATGSWTFGWKRAEILSAAGNGITLLVVSAIVAFEAIRRLIHPPAVEGGPVLVVAVIGVVVNIVAAWVLAKANRSRPQHRRRLPAHPHRPLRLHRHRRRRDHHPHHGLHPRRRHRLLDRGRPNGQSRVGVAAGLRPSSARSRTAGHRPHRHPYASPRTRPRPRRPRPTRLDGHLDPARLSAHVVLDDSCFTDGHAPQLLDELQHCLVGHFDVEHSTVQLEPASHAAHELGAH